MAENTGYKDQIKDITDRLETGIQDLFTSEKYQSYLKTMSKFHNYSTRNTLLIHMQMPEARQVAGFRAWEEKFGRHVKKGEHGIRIFAPIASKTKEQREKLDPDTKAPLIGTDGKVVTEEVLVSSPRFKLIPVFDASQTYGKPLPSLVEDLIGDVQQYDAFMDALKAVSPLPIMIEPIDSGADGVCYYGERIAIREGMSEIQTVSAVVHEIAHTKLHDIYTELENGAEPPKVKDKNTREVESESISYSVCQFFGIETAANSFGYIQSWSSDRELSELKASLDTIRKTSTALISGIESKFKELLNERGIDLAPKEQPVVEDISEPTEPTDAVPSLPVAEPEPTETKALSFKVGDTVVLENEREFRIREIDEEFDTVKLTDIKFPMLMRSMSISEFAYFYEMYEQPVPPEQAQQIQSPIQESADIKPKTELRENQHLENIDGIDFVFTSVKPAPTPVAKPEKQYDLSYGHLGNGLTVWNKLEEKNGDYVTVAHISTDRAVRIYDKDMPNHLQEDIQKVAQTANMSISSTQDTPVFSEPPTIEPELQQPISIDPTVEPEQEPHVPEEPPYDGILPDPAIGLSERDLYGYTSNELLPLTQEKALDLFDQDHTIYLLYTDNTEAMAFDREEIENFDGIFGIEVEEWEASLDFKQMLQDTQNSEASKEALLIYGKDDTYGIYQLKDGDTTRDYRFEPIANLESRGLAVERGNYELIYTAPLGEKDTLNSLYEKFNIAHPDDFKGHSLSISDIVVIQQNGDISSHYVDSFGFQDLPSFLGMEKQVEQLISDEKAVAEPPDLQEHVEQSVYKNPLAYAREHSELEQFRADVNLNAECKNAIDTAINGSRYDTNFYTMKDAVKEVTDVYGTERVELIMAKLVQGADWDGRYSRQNKDWAKGFEIPQSMKDVYSNTHPCLLDGFLSKVREKPSILEAIKQNGNEKNTKLPELHQSTKKSKQKEI